MSILENSQQVNSDLLTLKIKLTELSNKGEKCLYPTIYSLDEIFRKLLFSGFSLKEIGDFISNIKNV